MGFGNINRAMGLCLMMWVAWIAPGLSVCPTWHLTDGKYEAVYRHYLKECLRQEGAGNPDGPGKNEGSGVETTPKVNPPVRPTVPTSGQNKVPSETAPNAKLSSEPPRIKQVNALRVATPRSAQPIQAVKSTTLESQTEPSARVPHPRPSRPPAIESHSREQIVPQNALPSFKPDPRLTVRIYPLRPEQRQDNPSRDHGATETEHEEYRAADSVPCAPGQCAGESPASEARLSQTTQWHPVQPLWAMAVILGLTIAGYAVYQIHAHKNYMTLHCE
ncbi:N8.1alpha [macacine gammaherpesvirus 12]|uniref:N8.1alpha n=1 Tax=macacine gammaherpesvirus 12 TaxID=2560571 RepID=A0A0B5D6H0_9GAMA|nr:N8.1alpha [Macaca nemestrina rhadinovirus 2]AJE29698.1 N8.1alpha [Macaca nemestrina rhadinovirus 2]